MRMRESTLCSYTIPGLVMVLVFVYTPIITNIVHSFFSLSSHSFSAKLVGISNYIRFFTKDTLPIVLKNSELYRIIPLVVQVGFGTLLALLLESKVTGRLRDVYRSIYYIPALIPLTTVDILLTFVYQPDLGILNSFLRTIGHGDMVRSWLGDPKVTIYCIMAMSQWQFTGHITLLIVVTIQSMSNDRIKAASIDGAGPAECVLHTILPPVREQPLVCSTTTVTGTLRLFVEIYSTIGGGPGNSTQVLGVFLYQDAFLHDDLGVTAIVDVFIFMVTVVLPLIQMRITRSGKV